MGGSVNERDDRFFRALDDPDRRAELDPEDRATAEATPSIETLWRELAAEDAPPPGLETRVKARARAALRPRSRAAWLWLPTVAASVAAVLLVVRSDERPDVALEAGPPAAAPAPAKPAPPPAMEGPMRASAPSEAQARAELEGEPPEEDPALDREGSPPVDRPSSTGLRPTGIGRGAGSGSAAPVPPAVSVDDGAPRVSEGARVEDAPPRVSRKRATPRALARRQLRDLGSVPSDSGSVVAGFTEPAWADELARIRSLIDRRRWSEADRRIDEAWAQTSVRRRRAELELVRAQWWLAQDHRDDRWKEARQAALRARSLADLHQRERIDAVLARIRDLADTADSPAASD
jgi:hypothetical protein